METRKAIGLTAGWRRRWRVGGAQVEGVRDPRAVFDVGVEDVVQLPPLDVATGLPRLLGE
ncbi:MAG: hypothetical protein ACOYXR_14820 [Nitrospirota bacterium]